MSKELLRKYIEKADNGDAEAQLDLGERYEFGLWNFKEDFVKALYYYELAAKQANAEARYRLGIMYEYGKTGIKRNEKKAQKYFKQAVKQGHSKAKEYLTI